MKYQKARFLEHEANPASFWGKEIWVEANPPEARATITYLTNIPGEDITFVSAILGTHGRPMGTRQDCVELLPEFQDDVPPIPFEQWLRENGERP